jgi:hypothetical protein
VPTDGRRDWEALLERLLAPLRSEASAFSLLVRVTAVVAAILAVVLLIRALT